MVNLRDQATKARLHGDPLEQPSEDAIQARDPSRLTPPGQDLLDALWEEFPIILPAANHVNIVASQVAEMRGEQRVIQFLQNIRDQHMARHTKEN